MSNCIIRTVPGSEIEVGMGVFVSTPPHCLVTWGEYATAGEADGEIRVMAALDKGGNDITQAVAGVVATAVDSAIEGGVL